MRAGFRAGHGSLLHRDHPKSMSGVACDSDEPTPTPKSDLPSPIGITNFATTHVAPAACLNIDFARGVPTLSLSIAEIPDNVATSEPSVGSPAVFIERERERGGKHLIVVGPM